MRKITLFAIAALSASASFAVQPLNSVAVQKKEAAVATSATPAALGSLLDRAQSKVSSRADEVTTPASVPTYISQGAFYLGLSQELRSWSRPFGFAPSTGRIVFQSLVDADAYNWKYTEYVSNTETLEHTSSEADLVVNLEPMLEFAGPTLKTTTGTTVVEYNDSTFEYLAGGSPYFAGFYSGEDEDNPELSGMVGVTPCIFSGDDWFSTHESAYDVTGATGYTAGGMSTAWDNVLIKYDENDKPVVEYTDLALTGYGYKLPALSNAYLLSGVYVWCKATTTAETPITVKVYGYDEEGYLDTNKVLGEGTAVLPQGNYDDALLIPLNAVNTIGIPTNTPIVVEDAAWVSLTGFTAESCKAFNIIYNGNLTAPEANDEWRGQIYQYLYPRRSIIEFTGKNVDTNEVEELRYCNPWAYGDGDLAFACEFAMYFIVDFPIVLNAQNGAYAFNAVIPTEGGENSVKVFSTEDIEQLYRDEEIVAEQTADWFTFEVSYDEENNLCVVTVNADALPEGETGRYGEIKFTGYACDFTVTVTQGEAGINSVVANGQGVSEFYDLQGRKLNAAPAKGLYIERNGSDAATKLAR